MCQWLCVFVRLWRKPKKKMHVESEINGEKKVKNKIWEHVNLTCRWLIYSGRRMKFLFSSLSFSLQVNPGNFSLGSYSKILCVYFFFFFAVLTFTLRVLRFWSTDSRSRRRWLNIFFSIVFALDSSFAYQFSMWFLILFLFFFFFFLFLFS